MDTRKTEDDKNKNRQISQREYELLREYSQLRKDEQGQPLDFEDLNEYEVPPRSYFPFLKKPYVSLRGKQMKFNMACIRLFEGIQYVVPCFNSKKKRLAIILCAEEESSSVEWARIGKEDKWVNKDITSEDFIGDLFREMGWNTDSRYRALGEIRDSARGLILVFELATADEYPINQYEVVIDPKTGKEKKRQVVIRPEYYKNRIGKPYSEYDGSRQASLFEDMMGYESGSDPGIATSEEGAELSPQKADNPDDPPS